MSSLTVFNKTGKEVGTYEVDPKDLAPRISKQLLHDAVVMYQANLRQGTFRTKSRAEVAGSTKKMYRQKGTGNARAGGRRSGVRRGGGHIFAKRPRDFSYHLPRKALQVAARMALASKLRDNQVVLLDELGFSQPKTREMAAVLKAIGCDGASVLVATAAYDRNVYRSGRNIARVEIAPVSELTALNVLRPGKVVMTTAAMDAFRQRASGKKPEEQTAKD